MVKMTPPYFLTDIYTASPSLRASIRKNAVVSLKLGSFSCLKYFLALMLCEALLSYGGTK